MAVVAAPTSGPLGDGRIETALIFVRSLDHMLSFYRDTLGLRVGFANDHFAELSAGPGANIALHGGAEHPPAVDGDVMIEFMVEDIEASVRQLNERGVKVDPIRSESFGKIAHFWDPEGHRIGLEQSRPESRSVLA